MDCSYSSIFSWKHHTFGAFTIYYAESPCQIRQGLQYLDFFPSNSLLLFKQWMGNKFFHTKNCKFPIDIMALDLNGSVLNVWTAEPGLTQIGPMPINTFFVLEGKAGWAKRNKIRKGTNLALLLVNK